MYDEKGEFYLDAGNKTILQKCAYENPHIPFNPFPKQAEMILTREKEVLIGGAAGGSKSTSLLMRALFYVQDDVNEFQLLVPNMSCITDIGLNLVKTNNFFSFIICILFRRIQPNFHIHINEFHT